MDGKDRRKLGHSGFQIRTEASELGHYHPHGNGRIRPLVNSNPATEKESPGRSIVIVNFDCGLGCDALATLLNIQPKF